MVLATGKTSLYGTEILRKDAQCNRPHSYSGIGLELARKEGSFWGISLKRDDVICIDLCRSLVLMFADEGFFT